MWSRGLNLLYSSFHEAEVDVKANMLSHSSSPLTEDHTFTCSDLHSTPTMVSVPLPDRWGEKQKEVSEKRAGDKVKQMPAYVPGIWKL